VLGSGLRCGIFWILYAANRALMHISQFNCVLDGLAKNGNGRSFPHFSAKLYGSIYRQMLDLLGQVMRDPYHGPRLERQLQLWAEEGWQGDNYFTKSMTLMKFMQGGVQRRQRQGHIEAPAPPGGARLRLGCSFGHLSYLTIPHSLLSD
jgi:hypothetical protein